MGFFDDVVDVGTALGKGIYSVGEDLVYGVQRTGEGLGAGADGRIGQIGYENELIVDLMTDLYKYGVTTPQSPLYRIVSKILLKYYALFPEDVLRRMAKEAAIHGGGYAAGRLVIGKALATHVAKIIALKIAQSAAYKQLAKKLGVSAGVGMTGVGVPITLLMLQGVAQRASHASRRLRAQAPQLHAELRADGGLDMLYFLVEKPLEKHIKAIVTARRNAAEFERAARRAAEHYGR